MSSAYIVATIVAVTGLVYAKWMRTRESSNDNDEDDTDDSDE